MLPVPMLGKLKIRKSNGVPVTFDVHRLLAAANTARDRQQWEKAAKLYWQALIRNDALAHIWLQYGHMLLQSKDYDQAEMAYCRARELDPGSDVELHLGHLHKERGNLPAATRAYMRAARASPVNGDAVLALHTLMAAGFDVSPQEIMSLLTMKQPFSEPTMLSPSATVDATTVLSFQTDDPDDLLIADDTARSTGTCATTMEILLSDGTAAIVFDASDLISYFRNARLPTGIQRVQIEMIRGALETREEGTVRVCAFLDHRDEWVEISRPLFRHLCSMSLESGDRTATDWISVLTQLRLEMTMADALVFPQRAYLINLGTSWWLQNYFLYVRKAKAESDIRYVPFVHDLIPVMANEHCVKELTQDFISWVIGAFDHADYYLVNSLSTKRDLVAVGARLGHAVDPERVAVIRLDADFRKPATLPNGTARLAQFGVVRENYILFVSTIESRKNHLGAFEAWIRLIKTYGTRKVPYLVCVGNRGWLNEAIYARLQSHGASTFTP
ncbi:tetratricopeptide repeat-containing glycosyltransferase family protein [Sphingomonas sp. PAMC 26621]|uniref:tetratricopeptide repeat-containing glycosyltransferase family protein n=1 Tax=Sphingomonas sp. PAMC 26621 TaxID=1112213 RepID=UPI0014794D77|nr:tetratricopeptide repeat-containing glycosyltransferase family protein [Sphingomonas sp. PAMC 26621]